MQNFIKKDIHARLHEMSQDFHTLRHYGHLVADNQAEADFHQAVDDFKERLDALVKEYETKRRQSPVDPHI